MSTSDRRHRPSGGRLIACLLGAWLVTIATAAQAAPIGQATAADKAAAREAYRDGQRMVEAKDYEGALGAFKRGYAAYEDPIFIFNIAQCHRLLGHKELAAKWYRGFLERVPKPPNLAEIQRWLARLDADIEAETKAKADRAAKDRQEAGQPVPRGVEPEGRPVDAAPSEPVPVYKKWWLWTIVGVVVVGGALGVGLGLGLSKPPAFNQTLPDFGPGAAQPTSAVVGVRF